MPPVDIVEGDVAADVAPGTALGPGGSAVVEVVAVRESTLGAVVTSILAGGARLAVDLAPGDTRVNVNPVDLGADRLIAEVDEWPAELPWASAAAHR